MMDSLGTTSADSGHDVSLGAVIKATSALLPGIVILNVGSGALMAIVGSHLSAEGASSLVIGAITSAYFVDLLGGSVFGARVIDRVGHMRAFAVYAAGDAIAILLLVFAGGSMISWMALRLVAGYWMAGLTMVAESWLNHRSTNATRGRVLSVYIIVMNVAFAVAPRRARGADDRSGGKCGVRSRRGLRQCHRPRCGAHFDFSRCHRGGVC